MSPAVLLLTLLLGTLGVCAAPLDKAEHPEEMVTRCIVEVLSNALAKPNAPPIDPECREILKKSSRHNQDENENDVRQYETINLKNVPSTDGLHHKAGEEAISDTHRTKIPEEVEKWHHEESESQEENEKRETQHVQDNEEDTGHSKERDFVDEEVERIHHKEHIQSQEVSKEDREQAETSQEKRHDITDEKLHETAKSLEEASDEEVRNLEDIMKRHHDNWRDHNTKPEKHHLSHSYEESNESEDGEERRYKSNHDTFGQRFLGYEEKRSHHTNKIDSSEQTEGEEKRHSALNAFEDRVKKNYYDTKGHNDIQSSDESKETIHLHRGSEEVREQGYDSEENSKESKRHHNKEEERHHEEKKHWPMDQSEEEKFNYEHSPEDSEESEEDIEKRHAKDRKLKEELFEKLRHHLLDGSEEQPYNHEGPAEDKKRYVSEAMGEMKRNYPERNEEEKNQRYNDEMTNHHYGNNKEDFEESNFFDNEKYKRHHPEYERRINHYGFPDELKWKNRFYDKEDDPTYNSEEENKSNMQNKNVFPEFSDYDWWGKKQLLEGMNHGYAEKRSAPKMHKFDMKRQYDRMDELAQLLNYKKKSVEFPDFYESEEIKKRHPNDRGSLGQRPLTEQEEKELENLAIMDMELQKIAEKLSNSRQG
uniref:Secretogranin-1 n=1 Tax=Xenopus tropicalis TaxID=8364 RepID=A0A6I8PRI4_XENTR